MLDNSFEQALVEKTKKQMDQGNVSDLKSLISDEINKAEGYDEDWQKSNAIKRIHEAVLEAKTKEELADGKIVIPKGGLIIPGANEGKLIYIKCKHCEHIGQPHKWGFRTGAGVFYLFTLFNVFGLLLYFCTTNPYICEKCGERNGLIKILNNGKEIFIKSLSTSKFEIISVLLIILGIGGFFLRAGLWSTKSTKDIAPAAQNTQSSATGLSDSVSKNDNFKIDFPTVPTRSEESRTISEKLGDVTVVTYSAPQADSNYLVFLYKFKNPELDESKKGSDVKPVLEGTLSSFLNVIEVKLKLISSQTIMFNGKQALRYQAEGDGMRFDGVITMKEKSEYHLVVEQPISVYQESDTNTFFDSFKFSSSSIQ